MGWTGMGSVKVAQGRGCGGHPAWLGGHLSMWEARPGLDAEEEQGPSHRPSAPPGPLFTLLQPALCPQGLYGPHLSAACPRLQWGLSSSIPSGFWREGERGQRLYP